MPLVSPHGGPSTGSGARLCECPGGHGTDGGCLISDSTRCQAAGTAGSGQTGPTACLPALSRNAIHPLSAWLPQAWRPGLWGEARPAGCPGASGCLPTAREGRERPTGLLEPKPTQTQLDRPTGTLRPAGVRGVDTGETDGARVSSLWDPNPRLPILLRAAPTLPLSQPLPAA